MVISLLSKILMVQKCDISGELHREGDLPASICRFHCEWYKNGILHRDGGLPACIFSNGEKMWYRRGKLHRNNNLPAVTQKNGYKEWWKNGSFLKRLNRNYKPLFIKFE